MWKDYGDRLAPIRITHISASPDSISCFYRTSGPLLAQPDLYNVRFATKEVTWLDMAQTDIICIPRPCSQADLKVIAMAKAAGVKVWVDFDDNLLAVPDHHPDFLHYMQDHVREAVVEAANNADLVTVSTKALQFDPAFTAAQIVPNALHPKWPKRVSIYQEDPYKPHRIMWRGGSSHLVDSQLYATALSNVLESSDHLHIMGWWNWPITKYAIDRTENVVYTKELPLNLYFQELEKARATIMVVPLEDIVFNRGKSNLAWLEASAVGAITVAPDWEEWQQPGVSLYSSEAEFAHELHLLKEMCVDERRDRWISSMHAAEKQSVDAYRERNDLLRRLIYPPMMTLLT